MKNFILLFVVVLISTLFSCKKKDVAPTAPPTFVNTKVHVTFGAFENGRVVVCFGQQLSIDKIILNEEIDMPNTQIGAKGTALYIDSIYHVDYGSNITLANKYSADLIFNADGTYTEINRTGNLQLKEETQYDGSKVLMFRP